MNHHLASRRLNDFHDKSRCLSCLTTCFKWERHVRTNYVYIKYPLKPCRQPDLRQVFVYLFRVIVQV